MTSSTSNSEKSSTHTALPGRKAQVQHLQKFVFRILLPLLMIFVLLCFGLDWVIKTQLIQQTSTHGSNKLFRIQENHPNEIPILGSSRAQCSYIPDTLGPNFYNYGINGIGFAVMDIFLQQELAHPEKKTPIVLNFDFQMFGYQMGDLNSYLPHSEIPEVKKLLIRNKAYGNHLRIPGIRYYGAMDALVKDRLNERMQLTKAINKGAAIEKAVTNAAQMAVLVQKRNDSVENFRPDTSLINTLIRRIQSRPDRMFHIVVAPYHSSYYESIPEPDWKNAMVLLQRFDALPNARTIFFDTKEWPDSLFFNTSHVSRSGAVKMSQMLRDSLLTEK